MYSEHLEKRLFSPVVSILVPIYGVENYIERCAISLFNQTYINIEYIFVNDCTPDNSIGILNSVIERYPHRAKSVKIINHTHNKGLAAARNTAVEACTGEFLLHVDSDDYIEDDTIDRLVAKQQENNADMVSGSYIIHHLKKTVKVSVPHLVSSKEQAIKMLSQDISFNIWGRLIRTSLYKDHQVYAREGWNLSEDYMVSPRLAHYAQKINVVDEYLYHYDFTNINSYIGKFSAQKSIQSWYVFHDQETFFQNQGTEYREALKLAKLKILSRHLFSCCKDGKDRNYFQYLRMEQKTTEKRYWRTIDLKMRLLLYIKNWTLAKLYVAFLVGTKTILDKIV